MARKKKLLIDVKELIDKTEVKSVYSGRPGCCCGCRGNHRYASKHRKAASKSRGYKVKNDEISDRSVSIITGKINKAIEVGGKVVAVGDKIYATKVETPVGNLMFGHEFEDPTNISFVSLETESRLIIAYMR